MDKVNSVSKASSLKSSKKNDTHVGQHSTPTSNNENIREINTNDGVNKNLKKTHMEY